MLTPLEVAQTAVKTLDAKKGLDIKLLKTEGITVLANYFVICTATSTTHVKTLADEVSHALELLGEKTLRTEGYRGGGWTLIDFGCVIVHVFVDETRKFYNLERLWADAESVDISGII